MPNRLKIFAVAAALAAGTSSAAMAQYAPCPPGYALYGGVCQPAPAASPDTAPDTGFDGYPGAGTGRQTPP